MGRKPSSRRQRGMWLATQKLPQSPGHPFYERLNQVLEKAGFDAFVEGLCARFYAAGIGRPIDRLESALEALLGVDPARFEVLGFSDTSIIHLHVRLRKER